MNFQTLEDYEEDKEYIIRHIKNSTVKELYDEMEADDLLLKMSMVFGQMGESPCKRSKAIYSGLTLAEYLRDEKNQDVLVFIDNIYRFITYYFEMLRVQVGCLSSGNQRLSMR